MRNGNYLGSGDYEREEATALRGLMLTAAHQAGVEYLLWSQYLVNPDEAHDNWLSLGAKCRGFSIKFLQAEKNGDDFRALNNRTALRISDEANKPDLVKEISTAAVVGNTDGQGERELNQFMGNKYGFSHEATRDFGNVNGFLGIGRLTDFVGLGEYYYLISTERHAMACSARPGCITFFDPNAGLVRCRTKAALKKFFAAYLGHSEIKIRYGNYSKISLKVRRYRK